MTSELLMNAEDGRERERMSEESQGLVISEHRFFQVRSRRQMRKIRKKI